MIDKLTDFELNKAIAELIFPDSDVCDRDDMMPNDENPNAVQVIHKLAYYGEYVDYCNDWNDLMPLVVEYLPMLGIDRKEFIDLLQSENPQRGLAECLLNVLQEKQGDD